MIFSTSGVYVLYKGKFIFQVGPTSDGKKLGVSRLGGHREYGESPLETARREALEEAAIHIQPVSAPVSFRLSNWEDNPAKIQLNDEVAPILIKKGDDKKQTVMYLAYTDSPPAPSGETAGLLCLSPEDIQHICRNNVTLREFICDNGQVILEEDMDKDLVLTPFPQMKVLARLLQENEQWLRDFLNNRKE